MAPRRSKKNKLPIIDLTSGPDKKGRFWLPLPSGKKLFFYSGYPGEKTLVRRGKRGRRGEQGDLLQVLEPHPNRQEAACRHFGVCGGCTLQHMPESLALELKSGEHYKTLKEQFPEAELYPPVPSPANFFYRTKVELTFLRHSSGDTSLGFHRRGRFDRGVNVGRCWLTPLSPALLEDLRIWMTQWKLKGWHPRENSGDLRYLVYRSASRTEQDLVALVVDNQLEMSDGCRQQLVELLQKNRVSGALLVRQSSVAGAVVADSVEELFGQQLLQDHVGQLQFELGWNSFFQVNPPSYERLLDVLKEWRQTPAGSKVLDLFCGVGSIGMSLYRPGDKLLGVELVEQAVVDARANAKRNGIPGQFEQRSAETWSDFETDLLILDPPRAGCHPKLIKLLTEKAPAKELFYVSCNPHRLAEELPQIAQRYRLVRAQAFDFFPQTHHVEMLLQFERRDEPLKNPIDDQETDVST